MTQLHATPLPFAGEPRPRSKPRILWGPTAGVVIFFAGIATALVQVGHYDPGDAGLPTLLIALGLALYWPGFSRTQAPTRRVSR